MSGRDPHGAVCQTRAIPPPLIYAVPFGAGLVLQGLWPFHFLPVWPRIVLALVVALVGRGWAADESTFQAYPLTFADRDAALEAVRELTGDRGKIVLDRAGGKLLVYAPAEVHGLISNILAELSVPAKNISLTVAFDETVRQDHVEAGVQGAGGAVISEKGLSYEVILKPELGAGTASLAGTTRQNIMVRSGGEAIIASLTEVTKALAGEAGTHIVPALTNVQDSLPASEATWPIRTQYASRAADAPTPVRETQSRISPRKV
mgnify:CR=1 FL=1